MQAIQAKVDSLEVSLTNKEDEHNQLVRRFEEQQSATDRLLLNVHIGKMKTGGKSKTKNKQLQQDKQMIPNNKNKKQQEDEQTTPKNKEPPNKTSMKQIDRHANIHKLLLSCCSLIQCY